MDAQQLMKLARGGHLPKPLAAALLAPAAREQYLAACGRIETRYTEACTALNDPCLEGGCAAEGEVCLQPLLRAEPDYQRECGTAWAALFAEPLNRVDAWELATP